MLNIPVILTVTQLNSDNERFKPSNPVISCNLKVQVLVPVVNDFIVNADFITSAKDIGESLPEPIFTVKGIRYIEMELLRRQELLEEKKDTSIASSNEFEDDDEDFTF